VFGKSKGVTSVLVVLLSLLVVSPQLMVALLTVQTQTATPALISVQNSTFLKTLSGFNETVTLQQYVTLETWTNGTMLDISEHILNSTIGLCINCTTWIDTSTSTDLTVASLPETAETQSYTTESNLYPLTAQGSGTDNLLFLLKGSNSSTCWVSYDHDDNYDSRGYYPGQWDSDYSLNGAQLLHIHLPAWLVSGWINGNLTAMFLAVVDLLIGHIDNVVDLTDKAATAIGILLGLPLTVMGDPEMELVGWLSAFDDIIQTIEDVWTHYQQENWVKSVVEEGYSGDGWAWRGPIVDPGEFAVVTDPFDTRFITQYDYYQVRTWTETFGSEGIFGKSTNTFMTYWYDHSEVRGAAEPVLSDYGEYPIK
jgi:hypothetical protein